MKSSLLIIIIQIINPVEFYKLIVCFCRDYNKIGIFYTEDVHNCFQTKLQLYGFLHFCLYRNFLNIFKNTEQEASQR